MKDIYEVIILGAGPAGLSAAIADQQLTVISSHIKA